MVRSLSAPKDYNTKGKRNKIKTDDKYGQRARVVSSVRKRPQIHFFTQ